VIAYRPRIGVCPTRITPCRQVLRRPGLRECRGLSIIEGSPHRFARRVLLSAWPVLGDKWNDSRWHRFNHAGRGEEDAPMDRVEVYQRRAEECLAKSLVSREEDLESALPSNRK
jgi:hypothetical protein